ncbi:MAG: hypothetical protein FJX65_14400 [Alphaproteobacteria bacterium]|nr:hypothetical protein [Alphaproteobacteria bacterium]
MESLIFVWSVAIVLGFITWRRSTFRFREATLGYAWQQAFVVLPRMPIALVAAGFITELLPQETISGMIGADSGWTGVLIATALGAIIPSGPIISFPIAIALYDLGAGLPQLVAFLTAWSVFAVHRLLMWEVPLMGWGFCWRRLASSLPLPFIAAGLAALVAAVR